MFLLLISKTITFNLPGLDADTSHFAVFVILNCLVLSLIGVFLSKQHVAASEVVRREKLADKILAFYIITRKKNVNRADADYILNSTLSWREKRKAIILLDTRKALSSREAVGLIKEAQ